MLYLFMPICAEQLVFVGNERRKSQNPSMQQRKTPKGSKKNSAYLDPQAGFVPWHPFHIPGDSRHTLFSSLPSGRGSTIVLSMFAMFRVPCFSQKYVWFIHVLSIFSPCLIGQNYPKTRWNNPF